ncbi:MAG TPA: response regulator [Chloroflexota bacterium]|nr:response regulator [Chloroflexota bacterium]
MGTDATVGRATGSASAATATRPVILIAEDDPIVRELLQEVFEFDLEAEVYAASGGFELLELLAKTTPSLIVLDIVMPDMDGIDIAEMVQADPRLRGTPIVAVTAQSDHEAIIAAGCSAVVEKPFQIDDLVQAVREVLGV